MRRHTTKILVGTLGVTMALGGGVALATAGDDPVCPYGNTPQAGQVQRGGGNGDQLRKRDGTGPRHAQQRTGQHRRGAGQGLQLRERDGTGPHHAAIVAQRAK